MLNPEADFCYPKATQTIPKYFHLLLAQKQFYTDTKVTVEKNLNSDVFCLKKS
jgi:hypothetical protein